jgi:Xaa-Pro aminopeptidase
MYKFDQASDRERRLLNAQERALSVLNRASALGLFRAGITELKLSREIQALGGEMFGQFRHWHKRIVRAGANTLRPYKEKLTDLLIGEDDILFVDMGPVFDGWEADVGRTFVIGQDERKLQLANDVAKAWTKGQEFFDANSDRLTGADLYHFAVELAHGMTYEFGGQHAGHLIGNFPHEQVQGNETSNYIHPENTTRLIDPDRAGHGRNWIFEIHFVDRERRYGGFFEQWLRLPSEQN